VATGLSGRSGLMAGGLVLSALMVGDRQWRSPGYVGMAANLLLLTCDLTTSSSRSVLVATLAVLGYSLLVVWFVWIAARLLRVRPEAIARHS
jgi:hypothetical protein